MQSRFFYLAVYLQVVVKFQRITEASNVVSDERWFQSFNEP